MNFQREADIFDKALQEALVANCVIAPRRPRKLSGPPTAAERANFHAQLAQAGKLEFTFAGLLLGGLTMLASFGPIAFAVFHAFSK